MLPFILAAVGGYLIGSSLNSETEREYADGGTIDKDYRLKLLKHIEKLNKNVNGFELHKEKTGSFLWTNKKMPEVKIYATPFYDSPNAIDFEEHVNNIVKKLENKKYKLTGDLDKDAKTYFDFLESKTSKDKIGVEDKKVSIGQTDKELYDSMTEMGYDFGKYGTKDFDDSGFSEMAINLGYRWDEKKKLWHSK